MEKNWQQIEMWRKIVEAAMGFNDLE